MRGLGSSNNPIDLDDEEETIDIQEVKERNRNRQIIEQAKLAKKPFYLCLAVVKTTIKGDIGHKNKTLNRAIINFFQEKIGINISIEHFNPKRPDPDYFDDNKINPKEFIIYGVDFLTTPQLRDRLNVYQTTIKEIKWIDSSTCKVKYNTESQAKKVLESVVADKENLKIKVEENDEQQYPQGWFSMDNYLVYYFQRQLLIRYSTEKENDLEKQSLEKYQKYEEVQNQLLPFLFSKFDAMAAYEEVAKEIQREKIEEMNRANKNHRHRDRDRRNRGDYRSRTRDRGPMNHRSPINTSFQFNRRSRQPSEGRMRGFREDKEGERPFDMRGRDRNEYRYHNSRDRRLGPAQKGRVYYDCNDIDDDLSFDFRSRSEMVHSDDQDLELQINHQQHNFSRKQPSLNNLSFIMNTSMNQKSKGNSQNLSFVFNNPDPQKKDNADLSLLLNNSQIDKNNVSNNDLSIVMNKSRLDNKEDLSFVFNNSRVEKNGEKDKIDTSLVLGERMENEEQDLSLPRMEVLNESQPAQEDDDFKFLFGIPEELSSIHQDNANIFSQVKEEIKPDKEEEQQYIDFVPKSKKKEKKIVVLDEPDSGY